MALKPRTSTPRPAQPAPATIHNNPLHVDAALVQNLLYPGTAPATAEILHIFGVEPNNDGYKSLFRAVARIIDNASKA